MRELSLNVLDIAQNSIVANASLIHLEVTIDTAKDHLAICIRDNGKGMSPQQLQQVRDPFYTTRTTRKVGMGIPLFRMAAEMTGGCLDIESELGVGTTVTAVFGLSHIDRMPLGDMCSTVAALIRLNPQIDFIYQHDQDGNVFTLDTRELREQLGDVPLNEPDVMEWIQAYLEENYQAIGANNM